VNHALALLLRASFVAGNLTALFAAAPDLSLFQIDPRLEIAVFAAEPDVVDPVALTFDEAGRMYMVEMRDYPYGLGADNKPGGTVRLLEDTDGDGKVDKSTMFARELSFPTSIAPWNGGVFVMAPPDILYLKDTNNDGVADVREVYFTGFVLGVTDSNANGLRWGLDNRLHGLNGGNGGTITSPKKPQLSVQLGNADFSFNPKEWDFTTTYQSSGGFGLVFDEFGRSFVTHNINHIQQRILPLSYLRRYPGMFPVDATQSISDHGDMARIFSISVAQTRPNHPEQAGHFSSAGGLGFIGYDAYPEDLYRTVTVGDVVANIIHRDVLETNGPVFKARRSSNEADREFIATRDGSARLVGLELGPDGALYLIDMQREVIEHPDYIPEKMRKGMHIRAGEDRGRIYRITPKAGLPKEEINLAKATSEQLVAQLEHHNQWRRMTAHRLLVEREKPSPNPRFRGADRTGRSVTARIAGLTRSKFAPARVHALWVLQEMTALDDSILHSAFADPEPGVVENAIRISEAAPRAMFPRARFPGQYDSRLFTFASHPSASVRMQLALTLGGSADDPQAQTTLINMLVVNRADFWIRIAALTSLRDPGAAFAKVLARIGDDLSPGSIELVRDLADLAVARVEHPAGQVVEVLTTLEKTPNELAAAGLAGLVRGLARKGVQQPRLAIQPVLSRIASRSDELFVATWRLSKRIGLADTAEQRAALIAAKTTARAANTQRAERLRAIERLRFGAYRDVRDALLENVDSGRDAEIQSAALNVLRTFRDDDLAQQLVARWPVLSPSLRMNVLNLLLSRRSFHNALVTGIEKGELKLGELNLDLEQRRTLLRDSTPDIKARAAKFIGDEEYSNRKAVVDEWLAKLPERGEATHGSAVFDKLCAQCHRAAGLGKNVGPDLTSISHRSVEDILYNILDPNMAISPTYAHYQVETKNGDLIAGILVSDTPDSVTLLQANEIKMTVPRNDIVKMRSTGTSIMPEGLEAGITPQEMRDLIAFLQQPAPK
jgi:putative membrane-bound dehydrogenase-like protein